MKVNIDSDEWYPVYSIITGEDIYESEVIEIPDEKVKQIQKVFKEFQEIQEYLKKLDGGSN
jgi:hypothetical protein